MELFLRLRAYRDERDELVRLRYDIDDEQSSFDREIEASSDPDEYSERVEKHVEKVDSLYAAIAKIETEQTKRKALRWRVPIPRRPVKNESDGGMWDWHEAHERHYLSAHGMSSLRREIHQEWEMWSKPWLSLSAIVISIISLFVSII